MIIIGYLTIQIKIGFGRGFPWVHPIGRDISYRIEDYTVTLDAPGKFLALDVRYMNPLTDDSVAYVVLEAFRRMWKNLDEVVRYVVTIEGWDLDVVEEVI